MIATHEQNEVVLRGGADRNEVTIRLSQDEAVELAQAILDAAGQIIPHEEFDA